MTLSDGSQWYLSADEPLSFWLERFASIMRLTKGPLDGKQRLIFSPIPDQSSSCLSENEIQISRIGEGRKRGDSKSPSRSETKDDSDETWEINVQHQSDHEGDGITLELVNMRNALYPIFQKAIEKGGLPFHAGLIEKKGIGVLLAASGDTGKSTCCRRLEDDWKPLSDDEALVVLDDERRFRVHPFPTWSEYYFSRSEKTWDVQYSVPVCGVFFLEQANTDDAIPIGRGEAAALVTESAAQVYEKYWRRFDAIVQRDLRRRLFDNACLFAHKVPAYKLRVSLGGRFWENIEQVLQGQASPQVSLGSR